MALISWNSLANTYFSAGEPQPKYWLKRSINGFKAPSMDIEIRSNYISELKNNQLVVDRYSGSITGLHPLKDADYISIKTQWARLTKPKNTIKPCLWSSFRNTSNKKNKSPFARVKIHLRRSRPAFTKPPPDWMIRIAFWCHSRSSLEADRDELCRNGLTRNGRRGDAVCFLRSSGVWTFYGMYCLHVGVALPSFDNRRNQQMNAVRFCDAATRTFTLNPFLFAISFLCLSFTHILINLSPAIKFCSNCLGFK